MPLTLFPYYALTLHIANIYNKKIVIASTTCNIIQLSQYKENNAEMYMTDWSWHLLKLSIPYSTWLEKK